MHCILTPRGQAASLSRPPEVPPLPNESPLAFIAAVDLLIVLIISDPGQFSWGHSHYPDIMASKWKEGQREGRGRGAGEMKVVAVILLQREITFPFSLCRTLLPSKAMNSVRLAPAASLRLDTAVHLTSTGSEMNKGG